MAVLSLLFIQNGTLFYVIYCSFAQICTYSDYCLV
uniref:Uncharacterized protein n=1 Tax=Arundo donax TaxID=35708 RepID=A0A0A9ECX0_ARUDO